MTKKIFLIAICFSVVVFGMTPSPSSALQSGGVEIGDLETGSVAGLGFETLEVDLTITALCVGGQKAWYPPTSVLDLRDEGTGGRASRPILIKLVNTLPLPQGFTFSADSAFAGPTSLTVRLVVNPGETRYVGIPISDFTYVTAGNLVTYGSHLDPSMLGGQFLILR